MKQKETAMKELKGFVPSVLSLFFVRLLKMNNHYYPAVFVILGVPPWRSLKTQDMWTKFAYEIKPKTESSINEKR